jgi:FAD/FMN-containing dehydrogenase
MADPGATWLARVAAAVGPAHVLTDPADVEPYLVDWRGRYKGRARAVVRPGSTEELSALVRVAAGARIPLVPQGGNTGLVGGATPDGDGEALVVSLSRMRRVREIDVANATLTVEAGLTLAEVQQAAAAEGLLFPLSLASEGSCTIGGNLSTNAGGTAVLRYGNARELVLGLEVVLPDGQVLGALRGLRKDNTGYDLKQLFLGAEGTLGIVTAAVLKLYPLPRSRATALVAVPDVQAAVGLLGDLRSALADRLTGFELMSRFSLDISRRHHPDLPDPLPGHAWYVLVQADDPRAGSSVGDDLETALGAAAERGLLADATLAQSDAQRARLWALRENISEGQRREGPNIKHDIALPVSSIPAFLPQAERALLAALPGSRLVIFGHLGDGNLHYNLSAPEGAGAAAFMEHAGMVNRIVHDFVHAFHGSISAEHGIGQLKREELPRYKSAVELDLMRRIKRAIDPHGIMNPGKVV